MVLIFKIITIIFFTGSIFAQSITDIESTDATYPAIKRSIDKGYFTLVEGNKFLPNQSVTRAELALVLDRMDNIANKASLSEKDISELKGFSSQFKTYLENQENSKGQMQTDVTLIKTEQKTVNYDMSRLEENIQNTEKKRQEQEIFVWVSLGLGILSVLK